MSSPEIEFSDEKRTRYRGKRRKKRDEIKEDLFIEEQLRVIDEQYESPEQQQYESFKEKFFELSSEDSSSRSPRFTSDFGEEDAEESEGDEEDVDSSSSEDVDSSSSSEYIQVKSKKKRNTYGKQYETLRNKLKQKEEIELAMLLEEKRIVNEKIRLLEEKRIK